MPPRMSRPGETRLELLAKLLWALVVAGAIVLAACGTDEGNPGGAGVIDKFNGNGDLTITSLR
jgi:hypothetical protein